MKCDFGFSETAHGYVGLFTQPYANKQYGTCMYAMGNAGNGELCLFLLTQGNFMDASTLAKSVTWQDIHIFPSQLDMFTISDVYNLVMELRKTKNSVTVHFPVKPKFIEDFEYDDRFIFSFDTTKYYESKANWYCYVEFTTDITMDCLTFGILISDGKEKIHIVPYFDEYLLEGLDLASLNDEYQLHVPYNPGYYGGLGWLSLYNDRRFKKYMKYIVPYKFDNWEEFEFAKNNSRLIPKRWGFNIHDRII